MNNFFSLIVLIRNEFHLAPNIFGYRTCPIYVQQQRRLQLQQKMPLSREAVAKGILTYFKDKLELQQIVYRNTFTHDNPDLS